MESYTVMTMWVVLTFLALVAPDRISGASVQIPPRFLPASRQDPGCIFVLPQNRNYAPTVTDEKTREELRPVSNQVYDNSWYIPVERNRKIRVNCGRGNRLSNHDYYHYIVVTCVRGTVFQDDDDEPVDLAGGISCSEPRKPTPLIVRNGTCFGNGTKFDINFVSESPPRKFYSLCMDEVTSSTLYSNSYIDGEGIASGLGESSGNRPDFRGQEFYPFAIKEAYKWENAYQHLADLLGSEELVDDYFPSPQFRFSRGHLFPNGDALKTFEKHATFYYLNTVPQWQNLNGGNWAVIEHGVRHLAEGLRRTFNVTTGGFGVTKLKDANNNYVEIWLARDRSGKQRLSVPRIVWKTVHDPVGNSAVAFVQLNNPWVEPTHDDIICTDICSTLPWMRITDFHVLRKGFSYCCDVQELRKVIPYVPDLKYGSILGTREVLPIDNDYENDDYNDSSGNSESGDDESDSDESESSEE